MEESTGTLLSLALISLAILASVLGRRHGSKKKKKRAPGPRRLPLIGNLLHLLSSQPQVALWKLAKKHGPVMSLRMGQVDVVVISSPAAAQEVLREKDLLFASRASTLATDIILSGNDIAFAPHGENWRKLRKLSMSVLLVAHKVQQLVPVRHRETLSLVRKVAAAGRGGKPVDLGGMLVTCSIAITATATLGQLCGGELQEQFMSVVDVGVEAAGGFCAADLFPSLWFVDVVTGLRRRLRRARRELDDLFGKIVTEHEARRGADEEDLLSVMLRTEDITAPTIQAVVFDLLTAGTETTSAATEWILSELLRNPAAMARAHAEVRRTLDGKRPEEHEEHLHELRYTRMAIKEGMRLHPVVPFLLPHLCREACTTKYLTSFCTTTSTKWRRLF